MTKQYKQHLDILISANEEMKSRNCLSPTGISYLDGLKQARKILFPETKKVNRKSK
jgi:hypothetical protein